MKKNINELCFISATEALTLFKSKSLSPVELLEAQIARTEAIESQINAFTYNRFEVARKLAKHAEDNHMKNAGNLGALTGITVALKDETSMRDENTTV